MGKGLKDRALFFLPMVGRGIIGDLLEKVAVMFEGNYHQGYKTIANVYYM